MSTQPVALEKDTWTLAYQGPTTKPVSVELGDGMGSVWLALSADIPTFQAKGHLLVSAGKIKVVELSEGENLYAYASPLNDTGCELIITD